MKQKMKHKTKFIIINLIQKYLPKVGIIPAAFVAEGILIILLPIIQFQILRIVNQDLFNLGVLSIDSTWASSIICNNFIYFKELLIVIILAIV